MYSTLSEIELDVSEGLKHILPLISYHPVTFFIYPIFFTLFYLKLLSCARSFRLSNVNRWALITIRGRCNGRRFRNSCSSGSANCTRVLVQQLRSRYRDRWLFEPRPADTVTCNTEHNNSHLPPPACCRHQGISRSIRQLLWQAKWARKEVDIRRVWCSTAVNNNRHIILPGNHNTIHWLYALFN